MEARKRIEALLESGKITPEEANMLLEALGEEAQAPQEQYRKVESKSWTQVETKSWSSNQDARILRLEMTAGDIDVEGSDEVSGLVVLGTALVSEEGQVLRVRPSRNWSDDVPGKKWVGKVLDHVNIGDLRIKIPSSWVVELAGTAGDVKIENVALVRGRWAAGDVNLKQVGGIDLSMQAGDLDASVRLTNGNHRISLTAGDLDLKFLPGSSVKVHGSVTFGDIDPRGPFEQNGNHLKGVVGAGEADLRISMTTGELTLEA